MNVIDIIFIVLCLGIFASLIIQIYRLEPLIKDIKKIKKKLDANKEHTDRRILRINSIMDSNVAGYERYGEALKQNTDKINILVDRFNKIIK